MYFGQVVVGLDTKDSLEVVVELVAVGLVVARVAVEWVEA